jgi:hypothetical protein
VIVAAQREVLNKPFKPARGGNASSLKKKRRGWQACQSFNIRLPREPLRPP